MLECEGGQGEDDETEAKIEEGVVRVVAGTMFILENEVEEAVATLTEGSAKSDLEWSVPSNPCLSLNAETDMSLFWQQRPSGPTTLVDESKRPRSVDIQFCQEGGE